jgi:glycosyltransferase involved in cell wall biosynthesis
MDKKIRVGMLISRFFPHQGGAEIQCYRLSQELARNHNDIFILTQRLPGLPRLETIGKIKVIRLGLPIKNRLGSLSYIIDGFFWISKHARELDILHAHLASSPAILACLASRFFHKPLLLKLGGSRKTGDISTSSSSFTGRIKLNYLKKCFRRIVCPSLEIGDEALKAGFPKQGIRIIPNGVHTAEFSPAGAEEKGRLRQKLGLPGGARIIIYTGRFERGKGLEALLKAWGSLPARTVGKENYLVLLGSGSLKNELMKAGEQTGSVRFEGWKENTADYLRASDCFILPSSGEGLSNALLEAMSCGLPCITTRIGGTTELVRHGENGFLITSGSENEILRALGALSDDSLAAVKLGEAARRTIEKSYSITSVAAEYMKLYSEIKS